MSVAITILGLVVTLSIVVFIHELGHLLAARRSKVVVEEFGFGYPPRLFSFWHSEGEIIIDGKRITIPRRFKLPKGLHARTLVVYETMTDEKGRQVLTRIEEVASEDPAAEVASFVELLDPGTMYSVNAIPFGGFAKMLGEEDPTFPGSLASKNKRTRLFVLAAGGGMNLLTAVFFFALSWMIGAPVPEYVVIGEVAANSPAEMVGLQSEDLILQIDDVKIVTADNLIEYTNSHLGVPVMLTVQRGDEVLAITVTPRPDPPESEGPIGITLGYRSTIKRYPWYEALWLGLKEMVSLIGFLFTVPIQIIQGLIPAELARPVGPVGVGQLVGDAVQYSLDTGWWFPVMHLMGTLSVALAVTNLLPLPGLDGGRILFVIVEGIRGRRVDPAKESVVHLVGLLILVVLMVFITWQDVVNPIPSLDWSSFF